MAEEKCPYLAVERHPDTGAHFINGLIAQKWAEGYEPVPGGIQEKWILFEKRKPEPGQKTPRKKEKQLGS